MEITTDDHKSNIVLCLDPKNPSKNGIYKIEDIFSSAKEIKEKKMKMIIELNENVRLESIDGDTEVNIVMFDDSRSYICGRPVNIDDLKLALRKMTAK